MAHWAPKERIGTKHQATPNQRQNFSAMQNAHAERGKKVVAQLGQPHHGQVHASETGMLHIRVLITLGGQNINILVCSLQFVHYLMHFSP